MIRRFRQGLIVLLVAAFLGTLVASAAIDFHWSRAMPSTPDAETGRTNEIVINHGAHVYVSDGELEIRAILSTYLFPLTLGGFVVTSVLNQRHRPFGKR